MNQSFREIFASAPLGCLVTFSDGTPRPPERFKRKLSDWQNRNGKGRLVTKKAAEDRSRAWDVDGFTLQTGIYGSGDVITMIVNSSFGENSALTFAIESHVPTGRFVILTHSRFVGTEYKAQAVDLAGARVAAGRHSFSSPGIYSVGENGALSFVEGAESDAPLRSECTA